MYMVSRTVGIYLNKEGENVEEYFESKQKQRSAKNGLPQAIARIPEANRVLCPKYRVWYIV